MVKIESSTILYIYFFTEIYGGPEVPITPTNHLTQNIKDPNDN